MLILDDIGMDLNDFLRLGYQWNKAFNVLLFSHQIDDVSLASEMGVNPSWTVTFGKVPKLRDTI